MKDIKKSILTIVIVFITLGIVGAETWLIYSQILGPIIPVIGAVFITSCLTLFIYKLISNARPKSNEELLDINTYKIKKTKIKKTLLFKSFYCKPNRC